MNNELRWIQRFQNFDDAYPTFGRVFERYRATPGDEIIQIALIQAFEFTFEIAWKTMKPTFRTLKCHTQVLTLQAFEFKGSNA